jgi:hypothetical protein
MPVRCRWYLPVVAALLSILAGACGAEDYVLFPREHGPKRGYHACLVRDRQFADLDLTVQARRTAGITHYGLVFRYVDDRNLYRLVLRTDQRDFRVEKVLDGVSDYATTRYTHFASQANRWYEVRLVVIGAAVKVWIDGELLCETDGFSKLPAGQVGVTVFDPGLAEFDDFVIRAPASGEIEFSADFDSGELAAWQAVGPRDVKGVWDVQPKVHREPPRTDFELLSKFQAAPAGGKYRTMFEFPCLARLRDGRLFTIFIEENQHGTPPWAAMPSSGRLWFAWSADMGGTWTQHRRFLDTPVDDRHCYVTELPDGRLLATFWVQLVAFGSRGVLNYVTLSDDGGLTWSDPIRWRSPNGSWSADGAASVFGSSSVTVPARIDPDGSLYLAIHTAGHDGKPPAEAGLLWSRDGGRTWGEYVTVAFDPERRISFVEPAILRLPSGRWIAVMRTEVPIKPGTTHPYRLGPTMWCTSPDGRTWTPPEAMPLDFTREGSTAPFLLQTATGVLVFVVNTGTAFSFDDGRTWVPQDLKCGYYPVLAEIVPGTVASLACGMGGQFLRLTKPEPGTELPVVEAPTPPFPSPPPLPTPEMQAIAELTVEGRPRVVRVRGALAEGRSPLVAPDDWPLLAAFGAKVGDGWALAGVLSDRTQTAWTDPFPIAPAEACPKAIGVGAARDGTLLISYSTVEGGRAYALSSQDRGVSWSAPRRIEVGSAPGQIEMAGDPVSLGKGVWLLPATVRDGGVRAVLLRSDGNGDVWRVISALGQGLVEPAVTVARDDRWVALARKADSSEIVQTVSDDQGESWSEPTDTGLRGSRPAIVELLETFFVAGLEGEDGRLAGGLAWDDLQAWLSSPIACGHLVRIGGRKLVGLGCGVDLAGGYSRLSQVPLDADEIARAEGAERRAIPAFSPAFELEGEWQRVEDGQGERSITEELATARARFEGKAVFLVYGRHPSGHLLKVTIDGDECPPVETRGPAEFPVTTCLAVDLPPGEHELVITPLLRWQQGTTVIGGIETVAHN